MEPFKKVRAVRRRSTGVNVDTDSIVPARFLRRIERTGWGEVLFNDWRYKPDGEPDPAFVLNQPELQGREDPGRRGGTSAAGRRASTRSGRSSSTGSGRSSRSSFADIFHKNCFENGVVPVILPEEQVREMMARAQGSRGAS